MSVIQCERCGRRIMAKEEVCPHCSYPVPHSIFEFSLPKFMKKKNKKKEKISNFKMEKHEDKSIHQKEEIQKQNKKLIECSACGKQISVNAKSCPHCGEPLTENEPPREKKKTSMWTWFFLLVFIGLVMGEMDKGKTDKGISSSSSSTKTYKASTELKKNLKGGYYACTTSSSFDEISMAVANKDNLAIGHLLSNGRCVLTKSGVRFSYIGGAGFGVAKIRAYDGTDSIILYTNHENVYY